MNENHSAIRPVACLCPCHRHGACLHIVPCCEGRCMKCGSYFTKGLAAHTSACGGHPQWSSVEAMRGSEQESSG
jgi:hypothetical protein